MLLGATKAPAENLALRDGVQIVGTLMEGGRIYWRRGSREDVGFRLRDGLTGSSTSALLWVRPHSFKPWVLDSSPRALTTFKTFQRMNLWEAFFMT